MRSRRTSVEQPRLGVEPLEDRSVPAAFTPGNLVVYRVGDGTAALSATAATVFLDEFTTAGALVQSIMLPKNTSGLAAGQNQLTASGSATSEGFLTLSADGHSLALTGYAADAGTANVIASAAPRVVGRVAPDGTADTSTTTTNFNGVSIRSATSADGSGFWTVGANTGLVYTPLGGSGAGTVVSSTAPNLRNVELLAGQLYVSSGANSIRLGTVPCVASPTGASHRVPCATSATTSSASRSRSSARRRRPVRRGSSTSSRASRPPSPSGWSRGSSASPATTGSSCSVGPMR